MPNIDALVVPVDPYAQQSLLFSQLHGKMCREVRHTLTTDLHQDRPFEPRHKSIAKQRRDVLDCPVPQWC